MYDYKKLKSPKFDENLPKITVYDGRKTKFSIKLAVIVGLAIIMILLLVLFVFQQYRVSGISMQPSLQNNDNIIILKLPVSWAAVTGHSYIPSRGSIVVFRLDGTKLIKRVIGLPGDKLVIKNGTLTIYNKTHPTGFDPDKTMAYGKSLSGITVGNVDETIPHNELYVLGDNRSQAIDSRYFGPINVNEVIGRALVRITPLNKIRLF